MENDKERSAIDSIYLILEEIVELKKELKLTNNSVKLLNNKIAKLSIVPSKVQEPSKPAAGIPAQSLEPAGPSAVAEEYKHTVKLFGRIKNQRKKPIKGVYIKIHNPKGEVLKSRETDDKGYWEARVVSGEYVVELNGKHINSKFRPINRNIKVDETMNEYEVK